MDQWGTVCGDEEWDLVDAMVVCRQLGYDSATSSYKNASEEGNEIVWMSSVQCHGNETSISLCRHNKGDCPTENYASVTCEEMQHFLILLFNKGDGLPGIRLIDGFSKSSGRVEVLRRRIWGTVCDKTWDLIDASVACRQLGFKTAVAAPRNASFGEGLLWFDEIHCHGNETSIRECLIKFQSDLFVCTPSDSAGVVCGGKIKHIACLKKKESLA
ncbi:hypothetical protein HOLleu_24520 [Holothuria leucospilota]|uniref:SRCR domain-containing protein n=1 Tax=Holothuria leucospilota TaxID=206669 RepID=A0A9Q1H5J9_HOLLE|nr:hypothetical protein HOLleu_24520 [Holothuria leucospilota]